MNRKDLDLERVAPTPEAYAALTEAIAGASRDPGHFLVMARNSVIPSESRMAAFAGAFALDLYMARQRVLAPAPQILRRYPTRDAASEWATWLRRIGLAAFALSEEDLMSTCVVRPKDCPYAAQGALSFRAGDDLFPLDAANVLCVVVGELREKEVETKRSLGVLMDGPEKQERVRRSTQSVIDIHLRAENVVLRLEQDFFDWSSLSPEGGVSSLGGFRGGIAALRTHLPLVSLEANFGLAEGALQSTLQLLERSTDAMQRWLRPTSQQLVERSVYLESNHDAFHLYSSLLRWEKLRG